MSIAQTPSRRHRSKNAVLGFFRNNLLLKLISIGLALSFWAWIKAEQVVETKGRVTVDYIYPNGMVPVEPGPRSVTVVLSGARGQMAAVNWEDLAIHIDASDAPEGELSIDFTDRSVEGLKDSLQLERISPPALDLQLDPVMSRETHVEPIIVGQPAYGYAAGAPSLTPGTVEISGPQSLVQNLVQVKTDFVDISDAELDLDISVSIAIESPSIHTDTPIIQVQVPIEPLIEERRIIAIPVRVEGDQWRPEIDYISATWQGPLLLLDDLEARQVYAMAHPPEAIPESGKVELNFREDELSVGFTLHHLVDTEAVRLLRTEPSTILISHTPAEPDLPSPFESIPSP